MWWPGRVTRAGGGRFTGDAAGMKRWAVAVLLALSCTLAVPDAVRAAGPACGDVLFVGAAGSGQHGLGAEVTHVLKALTAKAVGRRVTSYALPYRAAGVGQILVPRSGIAEYMASLIEGESLLNTFLFSRVRQCPAERLVLAGYSQGAMVIHRSLQLLGSVVTNRVDAVVLIGDGDRLPGDNVLSYGTASTRAKGVGQWYPAYSQASAAKLGLTGRVFSVCNVKDIVCDHSPLLLASTRTAWASVAVHTGYGTGRLLTTVGGLAATKLHRDAFTVYRTSGRAGFVSFATGFTCPAGHSDMRIVTQGAGQNAFGGLYDDYLGPTGDIRVSTTPDVAPGAYTAYVGCETGGAVVKRYQFTQTVNAPAPVLGVSPAAASSGDRLTISAGTGCGAYTTNTQNVEVSIYDALIGGYPVVETTGAVTAGGQWGPVSVVLPPRYGAGGWDVTATCQAAAPDSPDQSYMQYGQVTVASIGG